MYFKIKKFVLQVLLEKAGMVLMGGSGVNAAPMLKGFQIQAKEGRLRVKATDLSLAVIAETELVEILQEGEYVFPGQRLMEISKEAEDVEGSIEVTEGEIKITFGKAFWTSRTLIGDYPELPSREGAEFKNVGREDFAKALDRVAIAISGSSVRPEMSLVHVTPTVVEAADGPRYHSVQFQSGLEVDIPGVAISYLVRQLRKGEEDFVGVGDTEQHLLFLIREDLFVVTKASFDAPDYTVYGKAASKNEDVLSIDRKEIESAMRRVKINADPETYQVFVKLDNDKGTLLARDKFSNYASHDVEVYWKGGEKLLSLNWKYFLDLLEASTNGTATFILGPDQIKRNSVVMLKEEDFIGIVNQVRVDPTEVQEIMS